MQVVVEPIVIKPTNIKDSDERPARRARGKKKGKKESFRGRVVRQTRETVGLAALLTQDPRAFPGALFAVVKRGFRAVWSARGGGLYACGFFVVFVWLEVTTFFDEITGADSVGSFVSEQLFEFFIRFTVQSLANTVRALIWPVLVIQWSPGFGLALLAAMYLVFASFVKQPLERWLFRDDPDSRIDDNDH